MLSYKERVKKLRQAEDSEKHVEDLARIIFPNKRKYN